VDIDALNSEHKIDGTLRVVEGQGGLPMIEIENAQATALISVHAGQVLAYRPSGASSDLLFVSERAYFAPGKAIKGGVPICWPWFGADPEGRGRPAHGFVRSMPWSLLETESLPDGATRVLLGITDEAETRAQWAHAFNLLLEVRVGETLRVEMITRNPEDRPFPITQALHTYFKVGDATRARVLGLEGCRYIDKSANGGDAVITQEGAVTVSAEVNRIYQGVPAHLSIEDPALGRRIRIETERSATCIVWNPWVETARAMADLDDEDYRIMVCVETANAADEVVQVPAGGEVRLAAEYTIEPL
jgi:glucose-6-phosphate 1-epimerase